MLSNPVRTRSSYLVAGVFVLALGTRIAFSLGNVHSPDNHIQVIELLRTTHEYPQPEECWSCFQPQLYYRIAAFWLDILSALGIGTSERGAVQALQILNALIGFATLLVIARWLSFLNLSPPTRLATIAIIALNPRFIIVNGRVTNDTLVIFLSTVGIVLLHLYFVRPRMRVLLLSAAAVVLGNTTKGSALPALALFAICLAVPWRYPVERSCESSRYLGRLLIVGAVIVLVFFGGTYARNLQKYKRPFVLNIGLTAERLYGNAGGRPFWYDHDQYFSSPSGTARPPWGAVAWESFLTFRPIDLVRHPCNDKSPESESGAIRSPDHMRSVWTQIYARANSARFHPVPPAFLAKTPFSRGVCRLIFILALAPLALVLGYLASRAVRYLQELRDSPRRLAFRRPDCVLWLCFVLTVLFAAAYNYHLGHFSATKAVYYYPGMCGFLLFFARGREWLAGRAGPGNLPRLGWIVDLSVAALAVLYTLDVWSVILTEF